MFVIIMILACGWFLYWSECQPKYGKIGHSVRLDEIEKRLDNLEAIEK
jgi:hypothetical protein